MAEIAGTAFVPLIAINDVLYHAPECRALQDVVTCIREHTTLESAGRTLEANAERHLKSPEEMTRLFRRARVSEAIGETIRFLKSCRFSLEELKDTEYADETRQGYATPQEALDRMITIMNRWALDGRNPNSYSGYFWTLGRYDRPWPERPVFGTIRAMSSINTAKKISVKSFITQYNQAAPQRNLPL